MYKQADEINQLLDQAQTIVILQADNPDADSLGSALALESILHDLGKEPILYCALDMPTYLRYLPGWDRVSNELPNKFDLSIVVDASTITLFEKLSQSGQLARLNNKPCIVLDHHEKVEQPLTFATTVINDFKRAATGEVIYRLAKQLNWPIPLSAQEFIMSAVLGDTQGLTNNLASAETYRMLAEFIEAGVNRPAMEEARRAFSKMPPEIYKYKAQLINRTEFGAGGAIASVVVPQTEINRYSPLYNPAALIQADMLQIDGVEVAIVFKKYDDGKVTGAIRCNATTPIAGELAEGLGGGGHAFASGFKNITGQDFATIKADCLAKAAQLLTELKGK